VLLGFFKRNDESTCQCRIVSYGDRIWLEANLEATVLRTFTLEILPTSKTQLSEIRMLLPFSAATVTGLKGLNDTAFDPNWYFNAPSLRTSRDYTLKRAVPNERDSFGVIDDDGIKEIKVFRGNLAVPSQMTIEKATAITFRFEAPLVPGEKAQFRLLFKVSGIGRVASPGLSNYYDIKYLNSADFTRECEFQGMDSLIPIYLVPREAAGGFSILIYSPPEYLETQGFDGSEQSRDPIGWDAKEAADRTKCVWQLDQILKLDKPTELGLKQDFALRGTFGKSIDTDMLGGLAKLQTQVAKQQVEIRKATIVAIVSAVLAVLALIPFLPTIIGWFHSQ
jgi:hypothetical protein